MVLELRLTGEGAVQFVVLVHGLGILDVLVEVEGVFLVYLRGEGGVGLLGALPSRAFIVQVAGVAGLFKGEVLSGIRQGLARGGLFRFLVGRACLAMGAAILGAGPVAGFAAYPGGEFVGVVKGVAAFLAPAVNVTAHAVLVFGVVFLGIQLGLLLGFSLGVGLERVHGLGVGGIAPGFSLALVTGTAFLATFKRLRGRAGGEDRKHGCCGKGECQGMAHGFLLRANISVVYARTVAGYANG